MRQCTGRRRGGVFLGHACALSLRSARAADASVGRSRGDVAADFCDNVQLVASVADAWGSGEETQRPTDTRGRDAVRVLARVSPTTLPCARGRRNRRDDDHDVSAGTPACAAVDDAPETPRGFTTPGRAPNTPSRRSARLSAEAPPPSLPSAQGQRKRRDDNNVGGTPKTPCRHNTLPPARGVAPRSAPSSQPTAAILRVAEQRFTPATAAMQNLAWRRERRNPRRSSMPVEGAATLVAGRPAKATAAEKPPSTDKEEAGAPKEGTSRKGEEKEGIVGAKGRKEGLARKAKRVASVAGRVKTKKSLSPMTLSAEMTPIPEKEICSAIVTMVKRGHAGASRSERPEIAGKITDELKVDTRVVKDVLAKLAEGGEAVPRRPGAGHPQRFQRGTEKGDRAVGGLLARFLLKQTANFMNELPLTLDRKPIS